ncbi:MAG TPA: DUF6152 family protein [Candidatus Saccharimonadales bacterium]|nr:DUF6152 family protein [Candidatus Saccharimonadales bacterium]
MKIKLSIVLLLFAGFYVVSLPGFAHHGSSAYDFTKLITAKAKVTSLEWGNPHCILKFETKDETGVVIPGSLEMYNPLWMARAGWSKETLKAGDEVEITFHPAKNGSWNGYIRIPECKILFHGRSLNLDENGSGTPPEPK